MRIKSLVLKLLLGTVLVCCVFFGILFWMADPLNFRALTDHKLISIFYDHRSTLERLRLMAVEGHTSYITKSNIVEETDESRKEEYIKLLSDISYDIVVSADNYHTVVFEFGSGGLSAIGPGWMKGIQYVPGDYTRHGQLVKSLDKTNILPPGSYLRMIEPNWFVVYYRSD
jgi:hypothetical protein